MREPARNSYREEKATLKDYINVHKGIQIPWVLLFLAFLSTLLMTYASLHISFFTGDMVDARGNVPTADLVKYAASYLGIAAGAAFNYLFISYASERVNLGIRTKLWRKIMYVRQSSYDSDGGETLVSRVTADCDYASRLLVTIVSLLSLAVSIGIYLVRMYNINPTIMRATLILIPISVLVGWGYAKLKYLIARKSQAMLSRTTTYLVERTRSLPLIKTANAQEAEIRNGNDYFHDQYLMQIKTGLMDVFYSCLQTAYNILCIAIPFILGAKLVNEGVLRAGTVIAFYSIATSVGVEVTNVISDVGTIRQANGALSRVIKTLFLPDEQNASGRTMDEPDQDISFVDVDFSYGEANVLQKIRCAIPKKKITAIVGPNGSGKSTLFKLLDRLYEPTDGTILFGESDASSYDLHAWRKAFCLVEQGSPLMEGTIRENICYGCERPVSREELVKVARQARIYDFVSALPDGFETRVAPGGTNFSGGQRQCIAIARAIMNNPDYLLLDEATSSLDASSERNVMEALEELMRGRTTVVIAHSLSSIRNANHVIVLKNGSVESSGSPEHILQEADSYLAKVMARRAGVNS
ncbi:MAG: ABC transporter ATP-binding protein [Lachnospiraceae bacterium]|nr:ABC transporter ATP-binding protein [Lachnospiraceae bacterium]